MNRNKRRRTPVLPMLMLLAALGMGTAGCSQSDYLLPTEQQQGIPTARGDEPLLLSIGAKPGFEGGSTRAFAGVNTRATVDDASGDFEWVADDAVLVMLAFTDANGAAVDDPHYLKLEKPHTATSGGIIEGWDVTTAVAESTALPPANWPEGATKCMVQAFATRDRLSAYNEIVNNEFCFDVLYILYYDNMTFKQEFAVGQELTIALKHVNTYLCFEGLAANTFYDITANGTDLGMPKSQFNLTTFKWEDKTDSQNYQTNDDGKMDFCLPLDDKLDANGKVTIEVSIKDTGTSVGTIVLQGTDIGTTQTPVYSLAGKRFNISVVANGGGVHPGNDPDLLP